MNVCIYGAASDSIDKKYKDGGEKLGEEIAKKGWGIVFGGGNTGMMGAAARGAERMGGKITGVAPSFFKRDGVLFENCSEFIYTETMRERKQIMEDMSDAFIVTPGGLGTFEEFFEIATLKQLGRHSKPIIIFNIDGYFNPFEAMIKKCIEEGFMYAESSALCTVCESAEQCVECIENYKAVEFDITRKPREEK